MQTHTPEWLKDKYMAKCPLCKAWYLKGTDRPYLDPIPYRWMHKVPVGPPVKCLADSLRRGYLRKRRERAAAYKKQTS